MTLAQRVLTFRALLSRVKKMISRPVQKRVSAPRLAEDPPTTWPQDASKLPCRSVQRHMVQDCVAPHAIEGIICKREPLAISGDELDRHLVPACALSRLLEVAERQIESSYSRAPRANTTEAMP